MNSIELWLKGVVAAIVGGAANSVASILADSSVFNPGTALGWKHIGISAASGALIGLVMYLKQSPVPPSPAPQPPAGA